MYTEQEWEIKRQEIKKVRRAELLERYTPEEAANWRGWQRQRYFTLLWAKNGQGQGFDFFAQSEEVQGHRRKWLLENYPETFRSMEEEEAAERGPVLFVANEDGD
jgi:hypothetical protein